MKKEFKLPDDLQTALDKAIKEGENEIKNNPPKVIALNKADKPKAYLVQKFLNKWWEKNGVKLMRKVAKSLLR